MENDRLDYLAGYRNQINFQLDMGEGVVLRPIRQDISELSLSLEEMTQLKLCDQDVIISVMELDEIADYLIDDAKTQPLASWWWHLGKIRAGTYPADLLPPHLRAVYASPDSDRKAA